MRSHLVPSCVLTVLALCGAMPDSSAAAADAGPATVPVQACFAPDTPQEYVDQVTTRLAIGTANFREAGSVAKQRLATRWNATATQPGPLALGDPTTIRWSYVPDGTMIPGSAGEPASPSTLHARMNALYPGGFSEWHALFVSVFERWGDLTGNTYIHESSDDGAAFASSPGVVGVRGDVRIAAHPVDGTGGILAYNFFPDIGDMVLDMPDGFYNDTSSGSLRLRNVLSHEHGHGLGLAHVCPVNGTKLMEPFASTAFDGPQYDDVLGGQRGYGDDFEHDDSPAAAPDLGSAYPPGLADNMVSVDGDDDPDFYMIDGLTPDATNGGRLQLGLTPVGSSYLEGPQCTSGTTFNPRTVRDLTLQLLESDGVTVRQTSNATPAGGNESIDVVLSGSDLGPFFARVTGTAAANAQRYGLTALVTALPIAAPGGPYAAECAGAQTQVFLNGSGSYDPDGGTVSHAWTTNCPGGSFSNASSPSPTLTVSSGSACDVTCSATLTVTDDEGQVFGSSASVRIRDTVAPVASCPADLITRAGGPGDPPCLASLDPGAATGTDTCDPTLSSTSDAPALFPRGRTLVTHQVSDGCGNAATCTQLVTVVANFECFAANCSKIQPGTGNGDGKVTAQGSFKSCDGDALYASMLPTDRVRLLLDGFVELDVPWSAFSGADTSWRYRSGSVTMILRGRDWKYVSRESDVRSSDLGPADGIDHVLEMGLNGGAERLRMELQNGDLQACRHGGDVVDCP